MSRRQSDRTGRILSISQRLLLILMVPLAAVLALSVLADYRLASSPAEDALDHALEDAALAVTAHLRFSDGAMQLEFSPLSEMILRSDQVDEVYFSVIDPAGRVVGGDPDLPWSDRGGGNPAYFDASHRGRAIRGVVLRAVTDAGPATIVVAETTVKRDQVARSIFAAMVLPNILLIIITLILVAVGVRYGLAPLAALRKEIEARSPRDLHPLPVEVEPPETRPLVAALNHLFRLIEESSAGQRRFLANAAHQLRTPLAALQTQFELAAADHDPQSQRAHLEAIGEATRRVARLTTQLLALAKSEPAANITAQLQDLDLPEVIEAQASGHLDRAIAAGIDLGFELQPAPVRAIPWLINELLANLVDNAIAYTPRGGRVTVRCGERGGQPFIEVEDNGPGIPVAERSRLFERFYRIPGTQGPGCGLGLAIVKEIADAHGATIELDTPADGQGTRVGVSFPAVPV